MFFHKKKILGIKHVLLVFKNRKQFPNKSLSNNCKNHLVAGVQPISNEKIKLCFWLGEGNINDDPIVNPNRPEPARSLLKINGGEVEESANLILSLKHISPVLAWLNWTVCSRHPILPRIQPLLYAIPASPYPANNISIPFRPCLCNDPIQSYKYYPF